MAQVSFNTKNPTIKRILKEAQELSTSPSADYHAAPLETNLFEWHFTLRGPPSPSPFADGLYHGRIVLPPSYPLRPPSFRFLTPSGRFEVNREICLSISGHHEESWQPAWGLRTALVALRSFMDTEAKGQLGGVDASKEVRARLARESRVWKCSGCGARSNEEVIRTVEEAAASQDQGSAKKEETVPEGLSLGYRDELGKTAVEEKVSSTASDSIVSAEAGRPQPPFTPVVPATTDAASIPTTTETPTLPSLTAPSPTPTAATRLVSTSQQQVQQNPLPPWIDKAIMGVAIGLAVMLLRKFLSLT